MSGHRSFLRRKPRSISDLQVAKFVSNHRLRLLREQQVFYAMTLQGVVSISALALLGYAIYKGTADLTVIGAAAGNIVATVGFHAWKCRAERDAST